MSLLSPSPALAKYASIVIDAASGRVLHQVNPHTRNYPASLTKMMTLYLLFEAIDAGNLKFDDRLKVSARSARQPASKLGLKKGETISVKKAILALTVKSANDVAAVIAEAISGSQRDFALKMTSKARQLGMNRTTFRNPSGLPHRGQLSTARDMAMLAYRLINDFPRHYHYFSKKAFTFRGKTYKNHNNLLKSYNGADGLKTGYIRASGYNLVTSAERNGHRLIGVVFGGNSVKSRDRHMVKLLDKGFAMIGAPLAAVAGNITTPPKPPAPPAQAKSAAPASKDGVTWAIQVGAYGRFQPALDMARKISGKLPGLLGGGDVRVVPLKKRNRRPLYRSRIHGLSKDQAYQACDYVRSWEMDCMEVRLKDTQLADAG